MVKNNAIAGIEKEIVCYRLYLENMYSVSEIIEKGIVR